MTSESKANLIKYLTGTASTSSQTGAAVISSPTSSTNNYKTQMQAKFTAGWTDGPTAKGNLTVHAIYTNDATPYGAFVLTDAGGNIVQFITSYTSGTKFGKWLALGVDESGYFFGIETTSSGRRFVMLNNITAKLPTATEYTAFFRASYNITDSQVLAMGVSGIFKSSNSAKYLIYGEVSSSEVPIPCATELTINVGSENTWTDYSLSTGYAMGVTDAFASWNSNGDITFALIGLEYESGVTTSSNNYLTIVNGSGGTMTYTRLQYFPAYVTWSAMLVSLDTGYFGIEEKGTAVNWYMYKFAGTTVTQIYSKSTVLFDDTFGLAFVGFYKNGENVFYSISAFADTEGNSLNFYYGQVAGNEQEIDGITPSLSPFMWVTTDYDLTQFYIQVDNIVYYSYMISNGGYYGTSYSNYTSLKPQNAVFYNGNNPTFARVLYNLTSSGNAVTASVFIPNAYENSSPITAEKLFSVTNTSIIEATQEITSNIYENLVFNFTEMFTVQNTDTGYLFPAAAVRAGNSMKDPTDYSAGKIYYYRTVYSDGSYTDFPLPSTTVSNNTAVFVFSVTNSKAISEIEILSFDKDTVYNSIDTTAWVLNSTHTITMNLEAV